MSSQEVVYILSGHPADFHKAKGFIFGEYTYYLKADSCFSVYNSKYKYRIILWKLVLNVLYILKRRSTLLLHRSKHTLYGSQLNFKFIIPLKTISHPWPNFFIIANAIRIAHSYTSSDYCVIDKVFSRSSCILCRNRTSRLMNPWWNFDKKS